MIKMKKWIVLVLVFGMTVAFAIGHAQATLIEQLLPDFNIYPDNDDAATITALLAEIGYDLRGYDSTVDSVALIDKAEYDDGGQFPNVGDYVTVTYLDPGPDEISADGNEQDAFLEWNFTGTEIILDAVAVKDGNKNDGAWQWYAVGDEPQNVEGSGDVNTWLDGQGAISHISLYGRSVPRRLHHVPARSRSYRTGNIQQAKIQKVNP